MPGARSGSVTGAIDEIIEEQKANGGWSQLTQLESDAYATGLALFTLRQAGVSVMTNAYQRGVWA